MNEKRKSEKDGRKGKQVDVTRTHESPTPIENGDVNLSKALRRDDNDIDGSTTDVDIEIIFKEKNTNVDKSSNLKPFTSDVSGDEEEKSNPANTIDSLQTEVDSQMRYVAIV